MEATGGELSLGVGRKRSDAEEYEMEETVTTERTSGDERMARENSAATIQGEDAPTATPAAPKPAESLPPYIPPPAPAVVADGNGLGRIGSRQSQSSVNPSYPRAVTNSSRRSSRVEQVNI
jgi:hypothetical protein